MGNFGDEAYLGNDYKGEGKQQNIVNNFKDHHSPTKANEKEAIQSERQKWDNPTEFILSCVAASVGLGNIWRFPFVAYENGGGAFLIPYVIVLAVVGIPLYYMELVMGQFSSSSSVKVWNMVPAFKGVGYGQIITVCNIVPYYASLMSLAIFYIYASFSQTLPWSVCPKNIQFCVDKYSNASTFDLINSMSAAEIYFNEQVLNKSPYGLDKGIQLPSWHLAICLFVCWSTVFLSLIRGIKSYGKVVYFAAIFPYAVIVILLGRSLTLSGAVDGVMYLLTPQWHMLLDPKVWFEAVTQCFFSLGVGFSVLIMLSSYNEFRHNVYRDAILISITDFLTCIAAGLITFAILGHLAELMGAEDINEIIKGSGPTLAFVSYPDVVARIEWFPQLFSVLFFVMLFTLGIGSSCSDTGIIVTVICDAFPSFNRLIVTLMVCITGFLIGLIYVTPQGIYILDLVDYYGASFTPFILAFFEVTAVHWVYGVQNFKRDIEFMLGRQPGVYLTVCWVCLIPLILSAILIYTILNQKTLSSGSYEFGYAANAFGMALLFIGLFVVPLMFIHVLYKNIKHTSSLKAAFKKMFTPSSKWGPKNPQLAKQYNTMKSEPRSCVKLVGLNMLKEVCE